MRYPLRRSRQGRACPPKVGSLARLGVRHNAVRLSSLFGCILKTGTERWIRLCSIYASGDVVFYCDRLLHPSYQTTAPPCIKVVLFFFFRMHTGERRNFLMQEKRLIFQGSATAMVTPFTEAGGLNLKTFDQLLDFQIAGGTDALVVCGTTGEPSTMDISEEAVLISHAAEYVNHRVPIIAGAGSNDTSFAVRSVKQAQSLGADALLLVTPYYNKTTQPGLIRHFSVIADATDLPIILYNVPSRTGLNLLPETIQKLSSTHSNIVGVKEASGDIAQVATLASLCPELAIYAGNDDYVVPVLSLGGKGVISVVSNLLPTMVHDMVFRYLNGSTAEASRYQLRLMPLIAALFSEVNPIPIKTALCDMGYDCGPLRLPLIEMQEKTHANLRNQMAAFGLL